MKMDADVRHGVFLVFKEAVNNVGRHARATEVDIDFRVQHHALALTVTDNGNGVDAAVPGGLGLRSMRARAERLRGQLELESLIGRGTRLSLTVPLGQRTVASWLRRHLSPVLTGVARRRSPRRHRRTDRAIFLGYQKG
ncbi:MAG: hypothetical protein GEU99_12055 [Luteitalea sp.]|nr:hypothetical protein [Luteitalea sp.]